VTTWTRDELRRIDAADELQIASLRRDGTLRPRVTIWSVRVGDDLYVRSVNGPSAFWFRGTHTRREGRIWSGGVEVDVTFEDGGADIEDAVDAAYRTKYSRYAQNIIDSIVGPQARSTTLRLVPRPAGAASD